MPRARSTTPRDRNLHFSIGLFFEVSPVFFFLTFFPGLLCRRKMWRKSPDFRAEKKAQNAVMSVAVMAFFGPFPIVYRKWGNLRAP